MILFTMLILILAIILIVGIVSAGIGGIAFLLVFGDLIFCVWLIVWIIKHIFTKKK